MSTRPVEPGVHLVRGRDHAPEIDAVAGVAGGRVGLDAVLADLDRVAAPLSARGSAASWAFTWDRRDNRSSRWWPQGITSSADHSSDEEYAGRKVLVTTAYSKPVGGLSKGARISVVDLTDPKRPRYRHVLLVTAELDEDGQVGLRPVHAHAGGIVWNGPHLHVAGTAKGVYTFHIDDVVAVGGADQPDLLGRLPGGGLGGFGHRYVLPMRWVHSSRRSEGVQEVRYSFLSLSHPGRTPSGHQDRGDGPPQVLAGEYGRGEMTTRLFTYDLDPRTGQLTSDEAGVSAPSYLHEGGVARMQGAVEVDGRVYATTSNGRGGRGSLWVGAPGGLREHRKVLPAGPEDICYWPSRDQLWTLTEYPRRRVVLALDRSRFDV